MKYVVDTLTPEGREALWALQAKGAIVVEGLPTSDSQARTDAGSSDAMALLNRISGVITPEEGDALIARIRYERDHDWE